MIDAVRPLWKMSPKPIRNKTEVESRDEAVGTNAGLKKPQSKANCLARGCGLLSMGIQAPWFMGLGEAAQGTLQLKLTC